MINKVLGPAGVIEWRENWPVVIAAMAGIAISMVHAYSLGVMILPLEADFGWTRAEITSGLLIMSFLAFPLAPIVGMAIDRFGPRLIALLGVSLYSIALALLSQSGSSLWTWWLLWVLLALASLFVKPTVWVTAISSLFTSSRGLALAVALSGTGVISFLAPMITYYFVENHGWRMAYVLWGSCTALIALPLVYFFFFSSKDEQRSAIKADGATSTPPQTGLTLRESTKSSAFLKLGASAFIMTIATIALIINLVPILMSSGLTLGDAAAIAGVLGLSEIVSRVISGFMLDRFNARIVGGVNALLPIAAALILLAYGGSVAAAVIAVMILGLFAGAQMGAISYLSGRYFGMRNFGALFGTISGLLTLGVGVGPVLANYIYDITKSYDPVLWGVIPLAILGSFLVFTLGHYPDFDEK